MYSQLFYPLQKLIDFFGKELIDLSIDFLELLKML